MGSDSSGADAYPIGPTPYRQGGTGAPLLRILSRLGQSTETAYDELLVNFPEWTYDHRGDGVASLLACQYAVGQEYYLSLFSNGINTNYRVVARTSLVKNPVTGVTEWNDKAAAVIRDYMTHRDGMRLPESLFTTPLAQAGWVAAYNRSNEGVAISAGGTEPRYRLWGSYQLNERPADVLGRMLACCDGRLVPTPDGGLTLDVGAWAEPSVILTTDAITGFSEVGRGRDVMTSANTIRATFLDPNQDYQSTDADPWADENNVSERGEEAKDVQFNMAPSHSQARRLMKLEWFRANPNWVGTFNTNLMGLAAFGERFVRIQYPLFGINSVFEVIDFKFILGEGGILLGATIQVQSMPQTAYQWDVSQEGTAPVCDSSTVDDDLPIPSAPDVIIQSGPVAELSFPPTGNLLLSYMVRWKKTADSEWTTFGPLANNAETYTTPALRVTGMRLDPAGAAYTCLYCFDTGSAITASDITFGQAGPAGSSSNDHMYASDGGYIRMGAPYSIEGGALNHLHATEYAMIRVDGQTVPVTGSPSFDGQFAGVASSTLFTIGVTYSGSATGRTYLVHYNGVIRANQNSRNVFPGTVVGVEQSGGRLDNAPMVRAGRSGANLTITNGAWRHVTPLNATIDIGGEFASSDSGRGGSVCLNSFGRFAKWVSASIMPPPSLVSAR